MESMFMKKLKVSNQENLIKNKFKIDFRSRIQKTNSSIN